MIEVKVDVADSGRLRASNFEVLRTDLNSLAPIETQGYERGGTIGILDIILDIS